MSNENLMPEALPTVAELLRTTGTNQANFLEQVAQHIEQLESEIVRLLNRVEELENGKNSTAE